MKIKSLILNLKKNKNILFIKFLLEEAQKFQLSIKASAVAFYGFISLIPFLILLISLIAFFDFSKELESLLIKNIMSFFPEKTQNYLLILIKDTLREKRLDILSVTFVSVLYSSTKAIKTFLSSFRFIHNDNIVKRGFFKEWLITFLLLFWFAILIVIVVSLPLLGKGFYSWLSNYIKVPGILISVSYEIIFFLISYVGIFALYSLGSPVKAKLKDIAIASLFSTFLLVVGSVAVKMFFDNFTNYNLIYGSLAGLIMILLWLYFMAFFIMLGFVYLIAKIKLNSNI